MVFLALPFTQVMVLMAALAGAFAVAALVAGALAAGAALEGL